jgi:DNA primase
MIENENMAVFDYDPERDAKFDTIQKKVAESMKGEFDSTVENYENIRQLYGTKLMREIYLK